MAEALYNASGLGLPIVMTVANRAIGAPINIWNDHSDSMSQRDSGWIQLYAESNQEALDLHIQAFKLAEELSLPVMVCMDGFILTHAFERVDVPTQEQVDAFLPPFEPRQLLDPADPVTIGAMVGPEAFSEVKYLMHAKQMQALDADPRDRGRVRRARSGASPAAWSAATAPRTPRRSWSRSARCSGTIEDVVDELRDQGVKIGVLGIKSLPALPAGGGPRGARQRKRVVVLEKAFAVGVGGIVGQNVRLALSGIRRTATTWSPASAAGRSPSASLRGLFADAVADRLEPLTLPRHGLGPRRARARAHAGRRPPGPARREHPARHRHRRRPVALRRATDALPADQVLPGGHLRGRQPPARPRAALGAGAHGALQHAHLGPPRLPGLRRGAGRALRARRGDARHGRPADRRQRDRLPGGLLDPVPGVLVAAALDPLAVRQRAGRGDRDRGGAEGQGPRRRAGGRARAATAARSTSASPACRGCSSATTTCSTSATTTRPT